MPRGSKTCPNCKTACGTKATVCEECGADIARPSNEDAVLEEKAAKQPAREKGEDHDDTEDLRFLVDTWLKLFISFRDRGLDVQAKHARDALKEIVESL